jgi:hypothetical protein
MSSPPCIAIASCPAVRGLACETCGVHGTGCRRGIGAAPQGSPPGDGFGEAGAGTAA